MARIQLMTVLLILCTRFAFCSCVTVEQTSFNGGVGHETSDTFGGRNAPEECQYYREEQMEDLMDCGVYMNKISDDFNDVTTCMLKHMSSTCGLHSTYYNYTLTGCAEATGLLSYLCGASGIPVGMDTSTFRGWKHGNFLKCEYVCEAYSLSASGIIGRLASSHFCTCDFSGFKLAKRVSWPRYNGYLVGYFARLKMSSASFDFREFKGNAATETYADVKIREILGFDWNNSRKAVPFMCMFFLMAALMNVDLVGKRRYLFAFAFVGVSACLLQSYYHFIISGIMALHLVSAKSFTSSERSMAAASVIACAVLGASLLCENFYLSVLVCLMILAIVVLVGYAVNRAPRGLDFMVVIYLLFNVANVLAFMEIFTAASQNLSFLVVKYLLVGMGPVDLGSTSMLGASNSFTIAVNLYSWAKASGVGFKPVWVYLLSFVRWWLPLVPRILLGVHSLRRAGNMSISVRVIRGISNYASDFHCMFRVVGCVFRRDAVGFGAAALTILLTVLEFLYSIEWFIIHIFAMVVLNIMTPPGVKALEALVRDYDIFLDAFPAAGSLPWFNVNDLWHYVEFTKFVRVRRSDGSHSGIGLISKLNDDDTNVSIISVDHVLGGAHTAEVSDVYGTNDTVNIVKSVKLGDGSDPVKAFETPDLPRFAAGVRTLVRIGRDEFPRLRALAVIHASRMVNVVTDFIPDAKRNVVHIAANLKSGDSGSPLFGILDNGLIRFVGNISAGTWDKAKNIASVACFMADVSDTAPVIPVSPVYDVRRPNDRRGIGYPSDNLHSVDVSPVTSPSYGRGKDIYERMANKKKDPDISTFSDGSVIDDRVFATDPDIVDGCAIYEDGTIISAAMVVAPPEGVSGEVYCDQILAEIDSAVQNYNKVVKDFVPAKPTFRVNNTGGFRRVVGIAKNLLERDSVHGAIPPRIRDYLVEAINDARIIRFNGVRNGNSVVWCLRTAGTLTDIPSLVM